jgi:hypothetical protein
LVAAGRPEKRRNPSFQAVSRSNKCIPSSWRLEVGGNHGAQDDERGGPAYARPPLSSLDLQFARFCAASLGYAHPNCLRLIPSFQIFVMCRIRSPSKSMT